MISRKLLQLITFPKMTLYLRIFILLTPMTGSTKAPCGLNERNNERLEGNWLKSAKVQSPYSCYSLCWYKKDCKSTNLDISTKECELKKQTMNKAPESIRNRKRSLHLEVSKSLCQNTKHACASQPCREDEICVPVRAAAAHMCLPACEYNFRVPLHKRSLCYDVRKCCNIPSADDDRLRSSSAEDKRDGGFTDWTVSGVENCPVTCGGSTITVNETRTCTNPAPANGGLPCSGLTLKTETRVCNPVPCPVDGVWSPWHVTSIGTCSLACGGGTREVISARSCDNPKPAHDGTDCPGEDIKTTKEDCNTHDCSADDVDGGWTEWAIVKESPCPVTCGRGTRVMTKERYCDSPTPQGTGLKCSKTDGTFDIIETEDFDENCGQDLCPIDGEWGDWIIADVDECSVSCGGGTKATYRKRECRNPAPSDGGEFCKGNATRKEETVCNIDECPVDGAWSDWRVTSVGACSKNCGTGQRSIVSERSCTEPAPAFGGAACDGDVKETEVEWCNTQDCQAVVDGAWSPWVWRPGSCSKSCGYGTITWHRERRCDSPLPVNGGKDCEGKSSYEYTRRCNRFACKVDGGWSAWTISWSGDCTKSCGKGTQYQSKVRRCNSPRRSRGGAYCVGERYQYEETACNLHPCPVDGGWSSWDRVSFGTCSVTCGGGSREEVSQRECSNLSPEFDGDDCEGNEVKYETKDCNMHDCDIKINGGWSAWELEDPSSCSASCGDGTRSRTRVRSCSNPVPANGGNQCPGSDTDVTMMSCNEGDCSVDGGWSAWGVPTNDACSVTCGVGRMNAKSTRTCTKPSPSNGGERCPGSPSKVEIISCTTQRCPVDGNWGPWKRRTNPCSATCGEGTITHTYTRSCDNPVPESSGAECDGSRITFASVPCSAAPCPVNGGWSSWMGHYFLACTGHCGSGVHPAAFVRTCTNPTPAYGGAKCVGDDTKHRNFSCYVNCNSVVDGGWSPWIIESMFKCSKTCGGGLRTLTGRRECNRPTPQNGGSECSGSSQGTFQQPCNENDCPVTHNGGWSEWLDADMGTCSASCGDGTRIRTLKRECINPAPSNGGADCQGDAGKHQNEKCNEEECPVDGGWTAWNEDSRQDCTKSCGGGTEAVLFLRTCTYPSPQHGGAQCTGRNSKEETTECNTQKCDVKCPRGFKKVAKFSMCYKIHFDKKDWQKARDHCIKSHRGDLAIFKSDEMKKLLIDDTSKIKRKGKTNVHIGGSFRNGAWRWVGSDDIIADFSEEGLKKKCLKIDGDDLGNEKCSDKNPYICQIFG